MKTSVVSFKHAHHFPLMVEWLKNRKMGENFSPDFLPPTGVVVSVDDKPVVIAFLILTDAKLAIRSDMVSNPDVTKEVRNFAAQRARGVLDAYAKHHGFRVMLAYTKTEKLAERLASLGYTKIQENLIEMGRFL